MGANIKNGNPAREQGRRRALIRGAAVTACVLLLLRGTALADAPAGSLTTWGCDDYDYGQCNVPAPNSGFIAVAAVWAHSLGLKSDGGIMGWGLNVYGQTNVPAESRDFMGVAAGSYHTLGLKSDGSIAAWGYNSQGQTNVPAPNGGFVAVAAGGRHSLGLKSDGSVVAWGWNVHGQANVPAENSGFVAVDAGTFHSLGLKSDGSIVAWGCGYSSDYGQCNVPTPNSDFIGIAAGSGHSLGIRGSKADYNGDGKIDATDYAVFWSVIDSEYGGGPSVQPSAQFWYLFDLDADSDVDLQDFALFANAFTGQ